MKLIKVEYLEESSEGIFFDVMFEKKGFFTMPKIYISGYFEKKREEIMKLIESVKYYNPFQKYVITEEDYEEAIKSLLNLDNYGR